VANRNFHVHLVSDSTGETVSSVARACLVQYEGVFVQEHIWSLVRTRGQLDKVIQAVEQNRGPVLYTLVDPELRDLVRDHCRRLQLPCVGVLDQAMSVLAVHFHSKSEQWPGRQHQLDEGYFDRIDAMHYTLAHDDGQSTHDLEDADVILVGPSRTSKTPTCVYLANRGVRAANVPLVPAVEPPPELEAAKRPLIVGLITDPERLVQIRVNRPGCCSRRPRPNTPTWTACSARSRKPDGSTPAASGRPSMSRAGRSRRRRPPSCRCWRHAASSGYRQGRSRPDGSRP